MAFNYLEWFHNAKKDVLPPKRTERLTHPPRGRHATSSNNFMYTFCLKRWNLNFTISIFTEKLRVEKGDDKTEEPFFKKKEGMAWAMTIPLQDSQGPVLEHLDFIN